MGESTPTDWLANLDQSDDAEVRLMKYMLTVARSHAVARFGPRARNGVGPSDIAAVAAASFMDDLLKKSATADDSQSLLRQLRTRVRNRSTDMLRRQSAEKRDSGRSTPLSPITPQVAPLMITEEQLVKMIERMVQLISEEPNDLQRTIDYLGLVEGYTAAQVLRELKDSELSKCFPIPSLRAIQSRLAAQRLQFVRKLIDEGYIIE